MMYPSSISSLATLPHHISNAKLTSDYHTAALYKGAAVLYYLTYVEIPYDISDLDGASY